MHGACKHFCGRFGTTDLVNKIKIYPSLTNLFHFEIIIIFSSLKDLS
jgi:hypothetical protein